MNHTIPSRRLREHPNLGQLKRQAKELLRAFAAGKPAAEEEVRTHYRGILRSSRCMMHSLCSPEAMDLKAGPNSRLTLTA